MNMPHEATVKEIADVYMTGWKLGLKAIAIYRDGSKRQQALTTSKESDAKKQNEGKAVENAKVAPGFLARQSLATAGAWVRR